MERGGACVVVSEAHTLPVIPPIPPLHVAGPLLNDSKSPGLDRSERGAGIDAGGGDLPTSLSALNLKCSVLLAVLRRCANCSADFWSASDTAAACVAGTAWTAFFFLLPKGISSLRCTTTSIWNLRQKKSGRRCNVPLTVLARARWNC